jgi:hypothetical protein
MNTIFAASLWFWLAVFAAYAMKLVPLSVSTGELILFSFPVLFVVLVGLDFFIAHGSKASPSA